MSVLKLKNGTLLYDSLHEFASHLICYGIGRVTWNCNILLCSISLHVLLKTIQFLQASSIKSGCSRKRR